MCLQLPLSLVSPHKGVGHASHFLFVPSTFFYVLLAFSYPSLYDSFDPPHGGVKVFLYSAQTISIYFFTHLCRDRGNSQFLSKLSISNFVHHCATAHPPQHHLMFESLLYGPTNKKMYRNLLKFDSKLKIFIIQELVILVNFQKYGSQWDHVDP